MRETPASEKLEIRLRAHRTTFLGGKTCFKTKSVKTTKYSDDFKFHFIERS